MVMGENYFVKQRKEVKRKITEMVVEGIPDQTVIIQMGKMFGYKHSTLATLIAEVKMENGING